MEQFFTSIPSVDCAKIQEACPLCDAEKERRHGRSQTAVPAKIIRFCPAEIYRNSAPHSVQNLAEPFRFVWQLALVFLPIHDQDPLRLKITGRRRRKARFKDPVYFILLHRLFLIFQHGESAAGQVQKNRSHFRFPPVSSATGPAHSTFARQTIVTTPSSMTVSSAITRRCCFPSE